MNDKKRAAEAQSILWQVNSVLKFIGSYYSRERADQVRDRMGGPFLPTLRDAAHMWFALCVAKYLYTRTDPQCMGVKGAKAMDVDGELEVSFVVVARAVQTTTRYSIKTTLRFPSSGKCVFDVWDGSDGAHLTYDGEVVRNGAKWRLQEPPSRPVKDADAYYDDDNVLV